MNISTLSGKNQTTLSADIVKILHLMPGTKLRQSLEGNRIILEPVEDVMTAFGALSSAKKFTSVETETTAMEKAIGREQGENKAGS